MEDNSIIELSLSTTIHTSIEMMQHFVEEKGDYHENR
jgi:hypothetical protein